jgi:hypothetical protein
MPRVKPRVPRTPEYAAHVDSIERHRDAAYDYAARKDEALEDVTLRHGLPLVVRESGPYRPDLGPEAPATFGILQLSP